MEVLKEEPIRVTIRGLRRTFYPPIHHAPVDNSPPEKKMQLEWVYPFKNKFFNLKMKKLSQLSYNPFPYIVNNFLNKLLLVMDIEVQIQDEIYGFFQLASYYILWQR